ncbi:hypothetical protein RAB80_005487 [Fusarium oxysporum f. sp. vasinfectum]|nr:hypothetical protein RAB80_005487 [Fusarium oxysporum f. sp. vasinfectum]
MEMAARPAETYRPGYGNAGVAPLPRHLEARGISQSRAASSSGRSSSNSQANRSYEPSVMSDDSCQRVVDGLMSLRYEIQDMGQRIEELIDLRKRLSHRAKRVNDAEAVFERRATFDHNFNRAEEDDQLEIYTLQERWVRAAINAAEKRLNYLQQYPFAYKDKEAIIGHVKAANDLLRSAWNGLRQIERNKDVLYGKISRGPPHGF